MAWVLQRSLPEARPLGWRTPGAGLLFLSVLVTGSLLALKAGPATNQLCGHPSCLMVLSKSPPNIVVQTMSIFTLLLHLQSGQGRMGTAVGLRQRHPAGPELEPREVGLPTHPVAGAGAPQTRLSASSAPSSTVASGQLRAAGTPALREVRSHTGRPVFNSIGLHLLREPESRNPQTCFKIMKSNLGQIISLS